MKMKPSAMRCLFVLAVLALVATAAAKSTHSVPKRSTHAADVDEADKKSEDKKNLAMILSALEKMAEEDDATKQVRTQQADVNANEARAKPANGATARAKPNARDARAKQARDAVKANQAKHQKEKQARERMVKAKQARSMKGKQVAGRSLSDKRKKPQARHQQTSYTGEDKLKMLTRQGPGDETCPEPMLMCSGVQLQNYPSGWIHQMNSYDAGTDCYYIINFKEETEYIFEVQTTGFDCFNNYGDNFVPPPVTISFLDEYGTASEVDCLSFNATRIMNYGFIAHFNSKPSDEPLEVQLMYGETREFYPECASEEPYLIDYSGAMIGSPPALISYDTYINSITCTWHIVNPDENGQVKLTFYEDFGLECNSDNINVIDGGSWDDSGPADMLISCDNRPDSITSTSNELFVQFTSDGSINDKGFIASVDFV